MQPPMSDEQPIPVPDGNTLVAESGLWGLAIFPLVRTIIDELEAAAPWRTLYYPPDDPEELTRLQEQLIRVVEEVPARVRETVEAVGQREGGAARLDDVRGYFERILGMIEGDLASLKSFMSVRGGAAMTRSDRSFATELAADLKGKCCSSLMAATTRVVAAGLWNPVEIEPVLFAEKAEEYRRNASLAKSLEEIVGLIKRLPDEIQFHTLFEHWLACERADQYAMVDLVSLLAAIGQLLKEKNRRALYSGDYHRILERERLLNSRIGELQALNRHTWSGVLGDEQSSVYSRLIQLTLEVVAILDAKALKALVGEERFSQLQHAASTGVAGEGEASSANAHLTSLIRFLEDDDLLTFLETLLANVNKRQTFVHGFQQQAGAGRAPVRTPPPVAPVSAEGMAASGADKEQETANRVLAALARMCDEQNAGWRSFAAVVSIGEHELQATTLREAQRFSWELAEGLAPLLAGNEPLREHQERLSASCAKLIAAATDGPGQTEGMRQQAQEIHRQLEELRVDLEARARGSRSY
jgi:hypothetical protein